MIHGVSDPYEAPENPDVTIDSSTETLDQSLTKILQKLGNWQAYPSRAEFSAIKRRPEVILTAAEVYRLLRGQQKVYCAKLQHHNARRCIFACRFGKYMSAIRSTYRASCRDGPSTSPPVGP